MILGCALLAVGSTNAQSKMQKTNTQYTSLGPIAGFGHSWLSNMGPGQNFNPSGYLGIGMIYSRFEHWGWGTNLVASSEGFKEEYYRNGSTYRTTIDPMYIRVTPRAYYFFGKYGDNVRPKVYLGPSVGFKVAENQYMSDDIYGATDAGVTMVNNTDVFRTVDFGAEAGAGVNIKLARSTWLNLDANYYHGFINVTDMENKNRNLRMNAGVMFGL